MIVPGSSSQALASALATELNNPLAAVTYDQFPDGETLAAVPEFDGDRAIIVATTDTNDTWIELLQLQDAVIEAGATEVITVIPYMGYTRQDRAFKSGHPVSARAMARAVSPTTDRVILINPHERSVADFFDGHATICDAAPHLAESLPSGLSEPLFVAPDAGAIELATAVRDEYGTGSTDYFEKTRHSGTDVDMNITDTNISTRDVVVVDDIIATGVTMSTAVGHLNDGGAARVYIGCIHPLLARGARTRLERAGIERIIGTDTIEREVSAVSVAPTVAAAIDAVDIEKR